MVSKRTIATPPAESRSGSLVQRSTSAAVLHRDARMTCDHLRRWLALSAVLGAVRVQGVRDYTQKVSILLREEPQNPKCFAESKKDLTCFWEVDEERGNSTETYTFTYTYENENSSRCPLRFLQGTGGKRLLACHLDQTQMFVNMDIEIRRDKTLIHKRSILVDHCFLLDPPANVTANATSRQGQLRVRWVPPPLKYMDNSMTYEVGYAAADGDTWQVEQATATSEVTLSGLQSGTNYKVRVRVKLDGVSYGGYWSAWSELVLMETLPGELNPLIMSLSLVISLILMLLSLSMLMSYRRFLIKKIWPAIPTPDSKFKGLFTDYGGDFQEWVGQTNGALWLSPGFFYAEEFPSSLEVLSELTLSPPLPCPPLPPKTSRAKSADEGRDAKKPPDEKETSERWGDAPQNHWLMERLRELQRPPVPGSVSSLMESQDAYVTLSANHGEDKPLDETPEEASPLEVLFDSKKTALSESHSDLGSAQHSSGSGQLSTRSSSEHLHHGWAPKNPAYAYMAVADSGVFTDYSPMSRADYPGKMVIYANEIPAIRRHFVPNQQSLQEDG